MKIFSFLLFAALRLTVILVYLFIPLSAASLNTLYKFHHLDQRLSHNTVESIFQDNKGFIWIGTHHGLNRYDGQGVRIYEQNPQDSTQLSNNFVRKICQDKRDNLWIATQGGLNRYDPTLDRFFHYTRAHNLPQNGISDVTVDSQGRVWAAAGGLCLLDSSTDTFLCLSQTDSLENYNDFIYSDSQDRIWYGTRDKLYVLDHNLNIKLIIDGRDILKGEQHFQEFIQDQNGQFWLATNLAGLYTISEVQNTFFVEQFKDEMNSSQSFSDYRLLWLNNDDQDRLWISCENAGLVVLDKDRKIIKRIHYDPKNPDSPRGASVWSIFQDFDKRLWFGYWNAGVDYIDPNYFIWQHYISTNNANSLSSNIVTCCLEDSDDHIWIGSDGGGLNLFNPKNQTFKHYLHNPSQSNSLSSNAVLTLCLDDNNRIWIGTWNGGINIFDREKNKFDLYNINNSGLQSDHIFALVNGGDGHIYIATWGGGLTIYNQKNKSWKTIRSLQYGDNGFASDYLSALLLDHEKRLWIGTAESGLILFDVESEKPLKLYQHSDIDSFSLSSSKISTIFQDDKNRIWVGTDYGLNRLNPESQTFTRYYRKDGLANNSIMSIQQQMDGQLWISTLNGLTRYNEKNKSFFQLHDSENLEGNQFNRNAACLMRSGELLFGSIFGFYLFSPDGMIINPHPPRVEFTGFKIFNKEVPITKTGILKKHISAMDNLRLPHSASVITFEFAALNYTQPEQNKYAYILQGFEKEWNYTTFNYATYTNLDQGDYVFRVIAANNNDIWNTMGAHIDITIKPPLWKTWWAILIYCLIFGGIITFVVNYRIQKQRFHHQLNMEHLKFEELYKADKLRSQFLTNLSHELNTPMMLIQGPLEQLLNKSILNKKIKSTINIVLRNAQRLSRLVQQLIEFYKSDSSEIFSFENFQDIVQFLREIYSAFSALAEQKGLNYIFSSNINYGRIWFNSDKLDKIIYNILSNAFQLTEQGTIELRLVYSPDSPRKIEISVKDTGRGLSEKEMEQIFSRYALMGESDNSDDSQSIIALGETKELVESENGSITVESKIDQGSLFCVQLPVYNIELSLDKTAKDSQNSMIFQSQDLQKQQSRYEKFIQGAVILIIEDNDDARQYLVDLFSNKFKILVAKDTKEAFEIAERYIPDLIISDIFLPALDGFELCNKLKSEEKTSHIFFILLSSYLENKYKTTAIQIGADAYLTKPFNAQELQNRVRNLLVGRKKIHKHFLTQSMNEFENESYQSLDEKFLNRIKHVVQERIDDTHLDAEKMSEIVGISRIQLYRKLKGLTGQSVNEFVRNIRLKKAAQILKNPHVRVTETAYNVGFNDLNYFSRCFRGLYKMSPSEYKASFSRIKLTE